MSLKNNFLYLYKNFVHLQNKSLDEKAAYELCNWAMENFDHYNAISDFVVLYRKLIEIVSILENKAQKEQAEIETYTDDLKSLIAQVMIPLLKEIKIIVYITDIQHRYYFKDEHVNIFLTKFHTKKYLEKKQDDNLHVLYTNRKNLPNTILNSMDFHFTLPELNAEAMKAYPLDLFMYDKLFLEGKFQEAQKQEVKIWVTGTSSAMCSITPQLMPRPTLNSCINVQDIYYYMSNIKRVLEINTSIDTIIIGLTYFSFYDDISRNPSDYTLTELCRVNFPIYGDSHEYEGFLKPLYNRSKKQDPLIDYLFDLAYVRDQIYAEISKNTAKLPYYNPQYNPRPAKGAMLNYRFQDQSDSFNQYAAKTLADRHYATFNQSFGKKLSKSFKQFLKDLTAKGLQILLYIPPMSSFYRQAVAEDKIKAFYELMDPIKGELPVKFLDYYAHPDFPDSYFQDYYHLNQAGSDKFTQIISEFCK